MEQTDPPAKVASNDQLGISVGSTVWLFDINRRKYRERKPGETYVGGGPIWREHWVARKVVGETTRSWVLDWGGKVPKKGANQHLFAFSEADINRRAWVEENKWLIARKLGQCRDFDTLLKVAAVLGIEAPKFELTGPRFCGSGSANG